MPKVKSIVARTPEELAAALELADVEAKEWQAQHVLAKRLKDIARRKRKRERGGRARTRASAPLSADHRLFH